MTSLLLMIMLWSVPAAMPSGQAPERAEDYLVERIGGYEVRINRAMLEEEALLARVRLHLAADLDEIEHLLPAAARRRLGDVVIWVEKGGEGTRNGRGLCTHWSADWLKEHGFLPEKAGGTEIGCAQDYVAWRRNQPYMLLHEFAHAYHWRLGEEFPAAVAEAFERAGTERQYEQVAYNVSERPVRAYAMNNVSEYFAELSEAYFGLNDYYPFTCGQLAAHDPAGMKAVEEAWEVNEPRE